MGVAKKNVLNLDFEHEATIIGIASNEKIWKLCWKLNQVLGLNLATAEDDVTRVKGPAMYTDFETDALWDYTLFENDLKPSQGTKLARQFRFWLVVKAKRDGATLEVQPITQAIADIDIVSLVHDISAERDIKKLLP
jgi:hypothetical protein